MRPADRFPPPGPPGFHSVPLPGQHEDIIQDMTEEEEKDRCLWGPHLLTCCPIKIRSRHADLRMDNQQTRGEENTE